MDNQQKYIKSLKNILLNKLFHLDIIKHGIFTLKNGTTSNIYIDFRKLINYPQLFHYLETLIDLMYPNLFTTSDKQIKLMPIPMGGLPLGNYLSFAKQLPQVMIRDKPKDHGTKKIIEGIYSSDDKFVIVEDVITSGTSIKEALQNLLNHNIANLEYKAILCICNRGDLKEINNIQNNIPIPIYSIFTLGEIEEYISKLNNTNIPINYFNNQSEFANELYRLASIKKSNIILSCDFMNDIEILTILDSIGDQIVAVKLHLDTIQLSSNEQYNYENFLSKLKELKIQYNFLIIEDAKFADIDTIMYEKIHSDRLMIANIADAITIHGISGLSILEDKKIKIPMIIVSEMSSSNNMIDCDYTSKIINILRTKEVNRLNSLGGLVCQNNLPKLIKPFEYLTMSPGINLEETTDTGNQCYSIPDKQNKVGLFWIVGRGITKYKDNLDGYVKLKNKMELYKEKGWVYFITY